MTNTYATAALGPPETELPGAVPDAPPAPVRGNGATAVVVSLMTSRAAADQQLAGSVLAHVGHRPEVHLVVGLARRADVLLVVASTLTDEMLAEMASAADRAQSPGRPMVMVTGPLLPGQLTRAVACGVVSILPAGPSTPDRIVEALLASAGGPSEHPEQPGRPEPPRAAAPDVDLTVREIEVLRLLADGYATNEIAERLHYSERTIKKDLHELMSRMHLRNRTHAVAHALRAGAI